MSFKIDTLSYIKLKELFYPHKIKNEPKEFTKQKVNQNGSQDNKKIDYHA